MRMISPARITILAAGMVALAYAGFLAPVLAGPAAALVSHIGEKLALGLLRSSNG